MVNKFSFFINGYFSNLRWSTTSWRSQGKWLQKFCSSTLLRPPYLLMMRRSLENVPDLSDINFMAEILTENGSRGIQDRFKFMEDSSHFHCALRALRISSENESFYLFIRSSCRTVEKSGNPMPGGMRDWKPPNRSSC